MLTLNEFDEDYPCESCFNKDVCDSWEAQYCCTLCRYYNGDFEPYCEECDRMNI